MPGKARPSLRKKTLQNVRYSNLSNSDKQCIEEVFNRMETVLRYLTNGEGLNDHPEPKEQEIIAVDFDGTLCENKWPGIGAANVPLFNYLFERKKLGAKLILWTCRTGERLGEAIQWCGEYGLYFDAINEDIPDVISEFGPSGRKVFATEYIDDRASTKFKLPFVKGE